MLWLIIKKEAIDMMMMMNMIVKYCMMIMRQKNGGIVYLIQDVWVIIVIIGGITPANSLTSFHSWSIWICHETCSCWSNRHRLWNKVLASFNANLILQHHLNPVWLQTIFWQHNFLALDLNVYYISLSPLGILPCFFFWVIYVQLMP